MGLTITDVGVAPRDGTFPALSWRTFDVTFDSSYIDGGESFDPVTLGYFSTVNFVLPQTSAVGHNVKWDAANKKLILEGSAPGKVFSPKVNVKDSDTAAATGVGLYVHIDEAITEATTAIGHLECVTAGNANAIFTLSNGDSVLVKDDDAAATGGLALYIDEDSTAGNRLIADFDALGNRDVLIPTAGGNFLHIQDVDTPGTPGVLVYFDDDGVDTAGATARLLFVSPTNADASDFCYGNGGEVQTGTDVSTITARVLVAGLA